MYKKMRAREAKRRNIVLYDGVKEADPSITDGKERLEADKEECERIFIAAGSEERKRHMILSQNWREGGRLAPHIVRDEIRDYQVRDTGSGEGDQAYDVKGCWDRPRSDEKAKAGRSKACSNSRKEEQGRADRARQGKKL